MLFYVRVEIENAPPVATITLLNLIEREWLMVARLMRRGKVLAAGKMSGHRGAVAIFNVASTEELDATLGRLPLFQYFTRIEIAPLVHPTTALVASRRRKRLFGLFSERARKANITAA